MPLKGSKNTLKMVAMMDEIKEEVERKCQGTQNNFFCEVCKITIHTEAEYALHEFSKKHCDNLLRIAKNKPVVNKQKAAKPEPPLANKEPPKVTVVTGQGNFAKYGYFVLGEVYETSVESKEFNTDYDPYIQKYEEKTCSEISQPTNSKPVEAPLLPMENITSFKRKKKKRRTCQICNVMMFTVPEYEAHMRSPQHIWKLKMSGMGVSAHFVKASTDLHTVEVTGKMNASDGQDCASETVCSSASTSVFPILYCDTCELLLNSEQQFKAHVNGQTHIDNIQKNADMKAKKLQMVNLSPNQLYCFSCKVSLNNLHQYNEHKYGKKHSTRCRKLMREGITIPPEERVASWGMPMLDPHKPVVYPELYEQFIKQKKGDVSHENNANNSEKHSCISCDLVFSSSSDYETHVTSEEHAEKARSVCNRGTPLTDSNDLSNPVPRMVFYEKNDEESVKCEPETNTQTTAGAQENQSRYEPKIIGVRNVINCTICNHNLLEQTDFEHHLTTEDHAKKIVEAKEKGMTKDEILDKLLKDKTVVKPDKSGRYSCSTCLITTGHVAEFRQHISSTVHKKTEEEYRRKRSLEIEFAINPDENGKFTCRSCQESSDSRVDYNHHLHTPKHKESMKAERYKKILVKKRLLLQQRRVKQKYIISGLKRKDFACWRRKCEKNPGIRTKVAGTATDLCTGLKATIPNLEVLEPKIEPTRNVTIGTTPKRKFDGSDEGRGNKRNNPDRSPHHPVIKPLMSVNGPRPFPPHPPPGIRLRHFRPPMHPRNWGPYPPIHPFRPNTFAPPRTTPFPVNRYHRPPKFHPPWPRYRPCY